MRYWLVFGMRLEQVGAFRAGRHPPLHLLESGAGTSSEDEHHSRSAACRRVEAGKQHLVRPGFTRPRVTLVDEAQAALVDIHIDFAINVAEKGAELVLRALGEIDVAIRDPGQRCRNLFYEEGLAAPGCGPDQVRVALVAGPVEAGYDVLTRILECGAHILVEPRVITDDDEIVHAHSVEALDKRKRSLRVLCRCRRWRPGSVSLQVLDDGVKSHCAAGGERPRKTFASEVLFNARQRAFQCDTVGVQVEVVAEVALPSRGSDERAGPPMVADQVREDGGPVQAFGDDLADAQTSCCRKALGEVCPSPSVLA